MIKSPELNGKGVSDVEQALYVREWQHPAQLRYLIVYYCNGLHQFITVASYDNAALKLTVPVYMQALHGLLMALQQHTGHKLSLQQDE